MTDYVSSWRREAFTSPGLKLRKRHVCVLSTCHALFSRRNSLNSMPSSGKNVAVVLETPMTGCTGILFKSYQSGVSHNTGCFARDILLFFSFAQSDHFSNVIPRAAEGDRISRKNAGVTTKQSVTTQPKYPYLMLDLDCVIQES